VRCGASVCVTCGYSKCPPVCIIINNEGALKKRKISRTMAARLAPAALHLTGSDLLPIHAGFLGCYKLERGRVVNGRPAYKHIESGVRWIAFDGFGWMAQKESSLGEERGFLQLGDGCASPDVSDVTWYQRDGNGGWPEVPGLRCVAMTEAEAEAESQRQVEARMAAAPAALRLTGADLLPGVASFLGCYKLERGRVVNGRPAYKHIESGVRWIAFDGYSWMAQKESSLGEERGVLQLDDGCASPDVSDVTWKQRDGNGGWPVVPGLRCTAMTEAEAVLQRRIAKLPAWAREHINTLSSNAAAAERERQRARQETRRATEAVEAAVADKVAVAAAVAAKERELKKARCEEDALGELSVAELEQLQRDFLHSQQAAQQRLNAALVERLRAEASTAQERLRAQAAEEHEETRTQLKRARGEPHALLGMPLEQLEALRQDTVVSQRRIDEQVEQRREEERTCPICLTARKNLAFQCGHLVCTECAASLERCPTCRQAIVTRVELFG